MRGATVSPADARASPQGFDVFVSDVDTVWMRDPLPFVLRYPDADLLTSSDHLANTVTVRSQPVAAPRIVHGLPDVKLPPG